MSVDFPSLYLSVTCYVFYTELLQSKNFPDHYIGVTDGNEGRIVKNLTHWRIVPGISGIQGSVSFQSVRDSNVFLRHRNHLIYRDTFEDLELFRADASFYIRNNAFFEGYVALESVNYPEHFIRHQNYRLKIAKDSSDLYKNDASFKVIDVYNG